MSRKKLNFFFGQVLDRGIESKKKKKPLVKPLVIRPLEMNTQACVYREYEKITARFPGVRME